jgi:DNA-binding transcriptional regulator YiaG
MTEAKFARAVDVSARTVANWHAKPETVPRNDAQDKLDELLVAGASPAVLARLAQFTGQQPAASPAPGDPGDAEVVSLGSHPHFIADFRAMACGEVTEARSALGLTAAEFAERLATDVGWLPVPGVVEAWAACVSIPPSDVGLAARFCLAGAR